MITITVPIYNAEEHLRDCINSIITQSFVDLEIILINDGSTDRSLSICNEYSFDKRIKIIDVPNQGLSSARQMGLDLSNGEYIVFLDADDVLHVDFVKLLVEIVISSKSDIGVCSYETFGNIVGKKYGFSIALEKCFEVTLDEIREKYNMLLSQYYLSDSWGKIYRIDFIKRTGIRFILNKKYNGTDSLFNYLLLLHCPKIVVVKNVLYFHRMHNNSRVKRKNKKMQEGFIFLFERIVKECVSLRILNILKGQLINLYYELMLVALIDLYYSNDGFYDKKKIKSFTETHLAYLEVNHEIFTGSNIKMRIALALFKNILDRELLSLLYLFVVLKMLLIR